MNRRHFVIKLILFLLAFVLVCVLAFYLSKNIKSFCCKTQEQPLQIIMLDIGQGDAILVKTPNNYHMLVDAGRDRTILGKIDKFIKGKDVIDILENSNPDLDHIGGMPFILEKYSVRKIISPGSNNDTLPAFNEIERLAKEKNIKIEKPKQNTVYVLDQKAGVTYTILWPEDNVYNWERNSASMIGLLEYGDKKVLFLGDAPKEVEDQIVLKYGKFLTSLDILKVGHHGSKTSTGENLVKLSLPKYAIISASKSNSYGHPHKEVTDVLNKYKIKTILTAENGNIVCKIYLQKETTCE